MSHCNGYVHCDISPQQIERFFFRNHMDVKKDDIFKDLLSFATSLRSASRWATREYLNLSAGFVGDDREMGKHCVFFYGSDVAVVLFVRCPSPKPWPSQC